MCVQGCRGAMRKVENNVSVSHLLFQALAGYMSSDHASYFFKKKKIFQFYTSTKLLFKIKIRSFIKFASSLNLV